MRTPHQTIVKLYHGRMDADGRRYLGMLVVLYTVSGNDSTSDI